MARSNTHGRRRRRFELKAIIKEYELLRLTIKLRLLGRIAIPLEQNIILKTLN